MSIPLTICFLLIIHYQPQFHVQHAVQLLIFPKGISTHLAQHLSSSLTCCGNTAVFYKEETETERYQWENYPLILPHFWLEGCCISTILAKKFPKNQEAAKSLTGGSSSVAQIAKKPQANNIQKTQKLIQNLTRNNQGRKIHWEPFHKMMASLAQKTVEH